MSLINDALRKARASQPAKIKPADGPLLRPVDPTARPYTRLFVLLFLLAVLLILACVLLATWYRGMHPELKVRAMTETQGNSAPVALPPIDAPAREPADAVTATANGTNLAVAPALAEVPPEPQSLAETNAAGALEPVPPPPPPESIYRLQGLFYQPKNPSALINGATVYVGEMVNGARVTAIDAHSATIVTSTGRTNILTFSGESPAVQSR